ncbi:MAG TPA: HD domain-containing phosphohydrolase [Longimicrobiaceae bacterium]|nr:HD domain-containing phosphohydrolase [Longimicrobiaceae bacterium]
MLDTLIEMGREAQRTGAWDEALAHFETALSLAPSEGDARSTSDLLRWIGSVHRERGDLDLARDRYDASREAAESAGLQEQSTAALIGLATVELLRGELEAASDLYLRAREGAEAAGDDRMVAMVDQNLGILANIRGNVAMALLSYRSALERYRRLGDEPTAARALNNMGMAHVDLAEWEAAERCFAEAAELAGHSGDAFMVGMVEMNRAELHLKRRRYDAARESCDRSLQVFHRLRTKPNIAEAYKFYGIVFRETGHPDRADTHFALSLGLAEACQNRLLQAEIQMEWAILHLEEERKQEGILYLNRALGLFRDLQARREVLDIERRMTRLRELYLPAVMGWGARLGESKDPYQSGHAERVAEYSTKLASEVGVGEWDMVWLRIGALVHDIGNVALPADVLDKSDALSAEEREIMKVHTLMGDSMASQLGFPAEVRPIVRSHHEHWAGTGYPDGLQGEEIPLSARIVCLADVYDALTSPRSFRPAFSQEAALRIMQSESGRIFDPTLFEVFRQVLLSGTRPAAN